MMEASDITGILGPPGARGPIRDPRYSADAPMLRRGRSACQGENLARAGAFGCEWAGRASQWPRDAQGRRVPWTKHGRALGPASTG